MLQPTGPPRQGQILHFQFFISSSAYLTFYSVSTSHILRGRHQRTCDSANGSPAPGVIMNCDSGRKAHFCKLFLYLDSQHDLSSSVLHKVYPTRTKLKVFPIRSPFRKIPHLLVATQWQCTWGKVWWKLELIKPTSHFSTFYKILCSGTPITSIPPRTLESTCQ